MGFDSQHLVPLVPWEWLEILHRTGGSEDEWIVSSLFIILSISAWSCEMIREVMCASGRRDTSV